MPIGLSPIEQFLRQPEPSVRAVCVEKRDHRRKRSSYHFDQLIQEHPDVDGVVASDVKAGHVLQACRRLGRRVPEDVKVVGYDDILLASLLVPRLTTIHQPIEEMGSRAVEILVAQIAGETVAMENVLPVSLVVRESA